MSLRLATWNVLHGRSVPDGVSRPDVLAECCASLGADLLAPLVLEELGWVDTPPPVVAPLRAVHVVQHLVEDDPLDEEARDEVAIE